MGNVIKNVVKSGLVMFAVGAALSVVAPLIALAVGIVPAGAGYAGAVAALGHTADVLWLGSFFGAFGAIHAAVEPLLTAVFSKNKSQDSLPSLSSDAPDVACVNIALQNAGPEQQASHFRDAVMAEKIITSAQHSQRQ